MRRARILFAALVLATAMPLGGSSTVLAATQGSCPIGDTTKVRMWENAEGDSSDGNDSVWLCDSVPNLTDVSHTPAGDCNRPWPPSGTWNDCISSYTVWVPSGLRFCVFRDADYTTIVQNKLGPLSGVRFDASPTWNDSASSFRWRSSSQNCED